MAERKVHVCPINTAVAAAHALGVRAGVVLARLYASPPRFEGSSRGSRREGSLRPSSTSAIASPVASPHRKQTNAAAAASACGRTMEPGASATSTTGASTAATSAAKKSWLSSRSEVAVGGLGRRRAAARYNDVGACCRRERCVEVVARYPDNVCAISWSASRTLVMRAATTRPEPPTT